MRISTNQFHRLNQSRMSNAYSEISKTQQQVASGKKTLSLADSPFRTAAAMQTKETARQNDRHVENLDRLSNRYEAQETALQSIITGTTRLRDLSIQAANQTLSAADHKIIGSEIQEIGEMMISLANTRDANGQYLFAGYNSEVAPVALQQDGDQSYVAIVSDDREAKLEVSDEIFLSTGLTAAGLFARAQTDGEYVTQSSNSEVSVAQPLVIDPNANPTGDDYLLSFTSASSIEISDSSGNVLSTQPYVSAEAIEVAGMRFSISGTPSAGDQIELKSSSVQDMFSQSFTFSSALSDGDLSDTQRVAGAQSFLGTMDKVLANATDGLATLGARMNRADEQKEFNLDYDVFLQERINQFEGVDMAEAISNLEAQMLTLQAVQASFSRISGLSLFDRL